MKRSYFIAAFIAIIALLWIGSGFLVPTSSVVETVSETETADKQQSPLMRVQVKTTTPQDYTRSITANGRSQASKNVTIRAESSGQVKEILQQEGNPVSFGDRLIRIDVREKAERVREAEELVKQKEIEYEAARRLIKQGFTSNVRLAQTQSELESARASLKSAEIALEKTTISAPFDGILGKRHVDVGDYLSIGDPVTDIVDLDPLEITVFVNEKEVVDIKRGNPATLRFTGGQERSGQVTFVAPAADEQTRTFRVDVEIDNANDPLPAGLTAMVQIEVQSKQAYKITPSILTLNDAGQVGVKTVGQENRVAFRPVTIIEDTPTHLWVTGLQGAIQIVTVGQDFITPGQQVEPVEAEQERN
jgi:multidrug efflux system membrane fusion protein